MNHHLLRVASLLGLALAAAPAPAAKVKAWHHHTPADHEKATFQRAVLSNAGALRLARRLRPLAELNATHVWALAQDGSDNLYAATGDEGKVFKVTPAGKASVVYQGDAAQVLSLAVEPKAGVVYAGTGPTGRVVRIDARGARVLCELKASYVWALVLDPRGNLYAATGPHGKIYRITPDGRASVFYDTRQAHVLCLALAADGTLYAGTDKTGRVYRIDPSGKGFVLHQAPQSEVRSLLLDQNGLYAGTAATKRRGGGKAAAADSGATARLVRASDAARVSADVKEGSTAKAEAPKAKAASRGSKTSAPSQPAAGDNSVWRIAGGGDVREVFRDKVLVLSLLRADGRLTVGTGMAGQLFEVDELAREKSEIARLDHGQVLCQIRRGDGTVVVGTGDPGKLYVLEGGHEATGTVVSEVLDAGLVARWGALRWRADVPAKTAVSVAVRSGNVAEPDDTWSAWGAEQTAADSAAADAPAARYLQYRVTLRTLDPARSPALHTLTLRYATANQPPEVTKVEVPDLTAGAITDPKKVKLTWSATDPNEDELRYRLLVRKDGWQRWVELEDDWDRTEYEWDATTMPSGVYQLKVVASDRTDNAQPDARTAERISAPFTVCHTPPVVRLSATPGANGRVTIEATATSPLVRLTAASFAVNGKRWTNVFPADGLFDDRRESFRFRTARLKPGDHVLVLRVKDAAGNTGSADVVFTVPEK